MAPRPEIPTFSGTSYPTNASPASKTRNETWSTGSSSHCLQVHVISPHSARRLSINPIFEKVGNWGRRLADPIIGHMLTNHGELTSRTETAENGNHAVTDRRPYKDADQGFVASMSPKDRYDPRTRRFIVLPEPCLGQILSFLCARGRCIPSFPPRPHHQPSSTRAGQTQAATFRGMFAPPRSLKGCGPRQGIRIS